LPFKRKSRGRSKGGKGSGTVIQCASCGQVVPRDKAKRETRRISLVDYALAKELRQKGTYIASSSDTKYYCVSCAVHRGIVKVRAEKERRMRPRRF
jgi:small subunit ribosomal protein S26e